MYINALGTMVNQIKEKVSKSEYITKIDLA